MNQENSDHYIQEELVNEEINAIKQRIASVSQMPVKFHGQEFEAIHNSLSKALSEIAGV